MSNDKSNKLLEYFFDRRSIYEPQVAWPSDLVTILMKQIGV